MSQNMDHNLLKASWIEQQLMLKCKLRTMDTEKWQEDRNLNLVGGLDLSYSKLNSCIAFCTLVICSTAENNLKVIYEDSVKVNLSTPYIPGFLAFREAEPCVTLYKKLILNNPELVPEVLIFDGNGVLHPRGLGLASHFGVVMDVCTIGVAKNLYQMENILRDEMHISKLNSLKVPGDHFLIENAEGNTIGAALKTTYEAKKPVYVSIGHRISLETAIWVAMKCVNKFRIPEPTRQADIRSRILIRNYVKNC